MISMALNMSSAAGKNFAPTISVISVKETYCTTSIRIIDEMSILPLAGTMRLNILSGGLVISTMSWDIGL